MDGKSELPDPPEFRREDLEASAAGDDWLDSPRYGRIVAAQAIRIVLRDTRLSGTELSAILGVGKTSLYRWMAGGFSGSRFETEALWQRLAEIHEQNRTAISRMRTRVDVAGPSKEGLDAAQA